MLDSCNIYLTSFHFIRKFFTVMRVSYNPYTLSQNILDSHLSRLFNVYKYFSVQLNDVHMHSIIWKNSMIPPLECPSSLSEEIFHSSRHASTCTWMITLKNCVRCSELVKVDKFPKKKSWISPGKDFNWTTLTGMRILLKFVKKWRKRLPGTDYRHWLMRYDKDTSSRGNSDNTLTVHSPSVEQDFRTNSSTDICNDTFKALFSTEIGKKEQEIKQVFMPQNAPL